MYRSSYMYSTFFGSKNVSFGRAVQYWNSDPSCSNLYSGIFKKVGKKEALSGTDFQWDRPLCCSLAAADGKKRALARHRHLGSASQSSTCHAGHGTTKSEEDAVRGWRYGHVALHDLGVDIDPRRRAARALLVEADVLKGLAVHDAAQPLPLASVALQMVKKDENKTWLNKADKKRQTETHERNKSQAHELHNLLNT